jgi:type II secretory pathway component PulF
VRFANFLPIQLWRWNRSVFYEDLADGVKRLVGIRDFLERERKNAVILKNNSLVKVLDLLSLKLADGSGDTYEELFHGIAPNSDKMLFSAVDAAEDKSNSILQMVKAVSFQQRTVKTLLSELATPFFAVPLVAAICLTTANIVATIAKDSPASLWVGFNGLVKDVSTFINSYWMESSCVLLGLIAFLAYMVPRYTGNIRLKIDSWPVFGLYRDYHSAVVLSSLAMMISSGKTVRESFETMYLKAGPWLRWQLGRVLASLEDNPNDYLAAFSRGLFSPKVQARLASLMDSSKDFDDALVTLGSSEVAKLEANMKLSCQSLSWILIGLITSLAIFLSVGQMTIANELSKIGDPSSMMKKQYAK